MSADFVFGFIQCLDGEKDPRNLMLAFTLIKHIIQEFDIAQHVEVRNNWISFSQLELTDLFRFAGSAYSPRIHL